jgi:hypothetical protein
MKMKTTNVKEELQKQIDRWVKVVKDFEERLSSLERHSREWEVIARKQAEYKGRIYAARQFGDVLGYEFETSYLK